VKHHITSGGLIPTEGVEPDEDQIELFAKSKDKGGGTHKKKGINSSETSGVLLAKDVGHKDFPAITKKKQNAGKKRTQCRMKSVLIEK